MVFIGDPNNRELSEKISKDLGLKIIYPEVHVFPDGERRIRINHDVANKPGIVLKSISTPVDTNLLDFCFTIDALKRNGINNVYGAITYLGYSRADHVFRTGEAVPLEVVIKMIEASGVNRVMIIDPHTIRTSELFSTNVDADSESAIPVFANKIKEMKIPQEDISIVTPDMGGIRRANILSDFLGGVGVASIDKERNLETGSIKSGGIQGEINNICMVLDDMISTGGTIVEAARDLHNKGVEEIYAFATHGVFAQDAQRILQDSQAKKIFITDSIPIPENKRFAKLEVLSLSSVIAPEIREWLISQES